MVSALVSGLSVGLLVFELWLTELLSRRSYLGTTYLIAAG